MRNRFLNLTEEVQNSNSLIQSAVFLTTGQYSLPKHVLQSVIQ